MIGFYAICLTGDLIELYSQLEPAAFRDSIASSPVDKEVHNRGMTSTEEISNVQHGEDCTMVHISLLRQPAAFSPNSNSQCTFYPHLQTIILRLQSRLFLPSYPNPQNHNPPFLILISPPCPNPPSATHKPRMQRMRSARMMAPSTARRAM